MEGKVFLRTSRVIGMVVIGTLGPTPKFKEIYIFSSRLEMEV